MLYKSSVCDCERAEEEITTGRPMLVYFLSTVKAGNTYKKGEEGEKGKKRQTVERQTARQPETKKRHPWGFQWERKQRFNTDFNSFCSSNHVS